MKVSARRVSFGCIQSAALKFFTSAAMRVGSCDASNLVMGPTPLTPFSTFSHACAAPMPTGETTPSPVMTALRFDMIGCAPEGGTQEGAAAPEGYCLTWFLT